MIRHTIAGEKSNKRGGHPLQKTVQVVDEAGIRYEATWEKRARGLVKNGRARFIDENTICLACPPNKQNIISEDMKMTNTETIKETTLTSEATTANGAASTKKYSLEYALEQIEKIANETSHVHEAISSIATMKSEATMSRGGSADEMAKTVAEVIRCRETTNQKLIGFYTSMVDDLKPKKEVVETDRDKFLTWVKECVANMSPGASAPDYARLWKEIQS